MERGAGPGAAARRPERPGAAAAARSSPNGATPSRSTDLQRRQELSVDPGRARHRPRHDRRHDEPVRRTVDDGGFEAPHNGTITWHHLLQQTSEWEGTLWGKPDLIDRNRGRRRRRLARRQEGHAPRPARARRVLGIQRRAGQPPQPRLAAAVAAAAAGGVPRTGDGADRRLARLGMARLPQFLCRDRRRAVQSVPGGSHWGGGVFIHARDQARIGLLDAARRRMGRQAHPVRRMDRAHAASRARSIRTTAISGGSTPVARCTRARRPAAIVRWAPAAT